MGPRQAVWSAWRSFARLACQRAWWNVLRRQDMSSMLSKFYHFFRNPQKWQGFARSKSECHDDGWSLQENVWTSYWHYISTTLLSCVWSAQQRSICWLPLRPTPQMRPSRPSVSRSVSCPLNEPWREILPIWIGWEFCIRHVPRPWKSNSTVQRGRRRHVQEAPGRWRTRLAGKEKEILSVQTSNSPGTSGGFSDFEMSWLDPREIHQTVQCQVCISTPWIWRRLGWLHHTRPCSHLQSRSVSLYCLARS